MIILYKGARGKGKTLSMVKDGNELEKRGYKVLRNFECKIGKEITNEEILELDKFSNIKNCVLMIDEIQIFLDSRESMKKQHLRFSNFIQQIRKRNIILLCTTQYSNTIDTRLRQHLDIIAYPNFIRDLDVCEVSYIDLTSIENIEAEFMEIQPKIVKVIFNAKPIYKLYNTNEIIA